MRLPFPPLIMYHASRAVHTDIVVEPEPPARFQASRSDDLNILIRCNRNVCVLSLSSFLPCARVLSIVRISGSCTVLFLLSFVVPPFEFPRALVCTSLSRRWFRHRSDIYSRTRIVLLITLPLLRVASSNKYKYSSLGHYGLMFVHISYIAHPAQALMETSKKRTQAKRQRQLDFYRKKRPTQLGDFFLVTIECVLRSETAVLRVFISALSYRSL